MERKILGALAAAALVVSACGNERATSSPTTQPSAPAVVGSPSPTAAPSLPLPDVDQLLFGAGYQAEAGRPGGAITVSGSQAAGQLNPILAGSSTDANIIAATMRGLFGMTADGHWRSDLAARLPKFSDQSIRADADGKGLTVDLELKPGLLWSDGQPLTMLDLAFTWKWIHDPAQKGLAATGWEAIDRVDVSSDGLKATVHLSRPDVDPYSLFALPFLPQHWMKNIPIKDAAEASYPLSGAIAKSPTSGPYKYDSASEEAVVVSRNPRWKGGTHPAHLDRITFQTQAEKDEVVAAFLANQTDVAVDLAAGDYDAIKGVDPATGAALFAPVSSYEHLDLNQAGGGPGHGHPALKDPIVRRAIAQTIDKAAMFKTVFPGAPASTAKVCTNALPTDYWRLPDDLASCPSVDLAAANAALDAAGYARGADGIRIDPKTKLPLVFEHCSSTAGSRTLGGEFLADSLQGIGIKLNLGSVDSTTVLLADWADVAADTKCNLRRGNYDTAELDSPMTLDLAIDYDAYGSDRIPTEATKGKGSNTVRFSDPEMDAALDILRNGALPADRITAAYRAQRRYVDDLVEIPLYYRNDVRGYATRIRNLLWNPSRSTELWNVEDWFIGR